MNKRTILLICIVVAGLTFIGVILYALTRPEPAKISNKLLTSNHYAEARNEPTNGTRCLEEGEEIEVSTEERTDIEYASMSHIFDVPAGTELDVKIATYSEGEVTGSNLYKGNYGNYNFTLTNQNGDWTVTKYQPCEK